MCDKGENKEKSAETAGPVKRNVRLTMDKEAFGQPWVVESEECPLRPHTDALGKKPPRCASGMMTNVQGAVPIHLCKYYQQDSIVKDGDLMTVMCGHKANKEMSGKRQ